MGPIVTSTADRITVSRMGLAAGLGLLVLAALAGWVPERTWWYLLVGLPTLVLDGVDGAVARRTGTTSDRGARWDTSTDAAVVLVLSVGAAVSLAWWAVLIGLLHYGYAAVAGVRPAWRRPLPVSRRRRVVGATQGGVLLGVLVPVLPIWLAQLTMALSLGLLACSFLIDIRTQEHQHAPR